MSDRFLTDEQIAAEGIAPSEIENPSEPIELTFERVLCPRHGEPFRAQWPKGYPIASVALLQAVLEDPAFADLAEGNVSKINSLLADRPLCERLSKPSLMAIYIKTEIGTEKRCELCHERGLGTRYAMGRPGGKVVSYRHVCFSCVLYRLQPAN